MNTALLIEIFGYIGCVFVVVSMLMTSVVKLRIINTVGSSISAVYAMIGHSYPLALVNASLVVINIYNLAKIMKADNNNNYELIHGKTEDSFLAYFIQHYGKDIRNYFPDKVLDPALADVAYTVCCEGIPAGILLGKKEANGVLSINVDYTTPVYRDCSVGGFLYSRLKEDGFRKLVCSEMREGHRSYLKKMGFKEENGVYVKEL